MKEIAKRALYFYAVIIGGALMSILTQSLAVIVARMLTASVKAHTVAEFVGNLITAVIVIFVCSFREGEKLRSGVDCRGLAISAGIAVVLQAIVAIPLQFAVYTSGAALALGQLFYDNFEESFALGDLPIGLGVLAILICGAVYVAAFLAGHLLGHRRYLAERQQFKHD